MNRQREQAVVLLQRAQQDQTAVEELLHSERVTDEIVGFHCQQAIEKLLKALLSVLGVRLRRTHDLEELLDMLADAGHPVPAGLREISSFTPYAAVFRYDLAPGGTALERDAALRLVRRLRDWVEPQVTGNAETEALAEE